MFTSIYVEFQLEKASFTCKMKRKMLRFPLCFEELAKMTALQNDVTKLFIFPSFISILFIYWCFDLIS